MKKYKRFKCITEILAIAMILLCSTAVYANQPSALVVGVGGWMSCHKGIEKHYNAQPVYTLVNNLRASYPGRRVAYALVCPVGLRAVKSQNTIAYKGPQGSGQYSMRSMVSLVEGAKPDSGAQVFIIGHSYGGAIAMTLTTKLSGVAGIFTIEPVSTRDCTVRHWLRNRSKRLIKRRQRIVAGCRRAPTNGEISWANVSMMSAGNWHNFLVAGNYDGYNRKMPEEDLHSSSISFATNHWFNKRYNPEHSGHALLGNDPTVWTSICSLVKSSMGAASQHVQCQGRAVPGRGY